MVKGERHTATNFVRAILQHSFGACNPVPEGADTSCPYCGQCAHCDPRFVSEPSPTTYCCWKHGYASVGCRGWYHSRVYPAHVFVIRSIYPWLLAMHRQPYEYDGPALRGPHGLKFSEFIRREFQYAAGPQGAAPRTVSRALHFSPALAAHCCPPRALPVWVRRYAPMPYQGSKEAHANPIQLWNAKVRSYVAFSAHANVTSVNLTHGELYDEDALRRRLQPLLAASSNYTLRTPSRRVEYPPFAKAQRKFYEDFTQAGFEQAKADVQRQAWQAHITQKDLDYINAEVSAELMSAFGLPLVTTSAAAADAATRTGRR